MNTPRPQFFGMLAGLFLAAGLVFSSMLATTTWLKVRNSQFVAVKGMAQRDVKSDLMIWQGDFSGEDDTLLDAQRHLQADSMKVRHFLEASGVTNFTFAPIGIEEIESSLKDSTGWVQRRTTGYRLSQSVRVETTNLDQMANLNTTMLVEQGVLFTIEPPQFIYTRLSTEKVEMLAEATKDARARADQIASQGGRSISDLHDAEMNVFQITPQHVTQTSWDGNNDTTSLHKTVTAVVTATFVLR
jgi:hypothetical protein